jgi:hypothetical protein
MTIPVSNPGEGARWPETHSHDVVTFEFDFDGSEPNAPPRPIPPKHLAYLMEVKRLLAEREQKEREEREHRQSPKQEPPKTPEQ